MHQPRSAYHAQSSLARTYPQRWPTLRLPHFVKSNVTQAQEPGPWQRPLYHPAHKHFLQLIFLCSRLCQKKNSQWVAGESLKSDRGVSSPIVAAVQLSHCVSQWDVHPSMNHVALAAVSTISLSSTAVLLQYVLSPGHLLSALYSQPR